MHVDENFDGAKEREILASIIWDPTVLAAVASMLQHSPLLFKTDVANSILKWAITYYEKYNKVPGDDIKQYPSEVAERDKDYARRLTAVIESLRKPLSNNSSRLIDIATKYFDKVHVSQLIDSLSSKLTMDDIQGCVESINSFSRVTATIGTGVNPLTDSAALKAAFDDNTTTSLLKFKSADERAFFGDTFSRASFVVINAVEKAGKSSLLLELALMAVWQGRKVAYFEAGDMSQNQVFRRIYQRIAHHPRRAGWIRVPTEFSVTDEDYGNDVQIRIQYDNQEFKEDMNEFIALEACDKWKAKCQDGINWKFSAHPQDLTVPTMCSILDEWERVDGFIPDFVIIDYADIIHSVSGNKEYRHQINDTFSRLRGVSLDRKCCLLTATQANGAAWDKGTMTREHLAEDKRKAAHPTAIIGLNASQFEREQQVAKLNYLVRRDDVCNEFDCLYMAQCLPICQPMVKTYFPAYRRNMARIENMQNLEDEEAAFEQQQRSALDKYGNPDEFMDGEMVGGDEDML